MFTDEQAMTITLAALERFPHLWEQEAAIEGGHNQLKLAAALRDFAAELQKEPGTPATAPPAQK